MAFISTRDSARKLSLFMCSHSSCLGWRTYLWWRLGNELLIKHKQYTVCHERQPCAACSGSTSSWWIIWLVLQTCLFECTHIMNLGNQFGDSSEAVSLLSRSESIWVWTAPKMLWCEIHAHFVIQVLTASQVASFPLHTVTIDVRGLAYNITMHLGMA